MRASLARNVVAESMIRGACHCGAVEIVLSAFPPTITECNCSLCRRYGVIWAYVEAEQVLDLPDADITEAYAWNGRHVDFLRCRNCGCITHWLPRKKGRTSRGINARIFDPELVAQSRRIFRDGASK